MKQQFGLIQRPWGVFYLKNKTTGEQTSLKTRDRAEAGAALAEHLQGLRNRQPVVLGIPRGGVVIGASLAEGIDGELDAVLTRKLGAPGAPETGFTSPPGKGTAAGCSGTRPVAPPWMRRR